MVVPDIKVFPQLFFIHHIIHGDGVTFMMPGCAAQLKQFI